MGACESQNRKLNSREFFRVAKTQNEEINYFDNPKNKIKLEFTIEHCTINDRYQVLAQFLDSGVEPLYTEEAKTRFKSITFNTCYICDFFFQKQQKMKVSIIKNGTLLGSMNYYLGMIVGSENSTLTLKISPNEKEYITISAEGVNNCNSSLMINFRIITKKGVNFQDRKNKFSYYISTNGRKVYQSESLSVYGMLKMHISQ